MWNNGMEGMVGTATKVAKVPVTKTGPIPY